MQRNYFSFLVVVLLFSGALFLYLAQEFRSAWRKAIVAAVEAQMMSAKVREIELKTLLRLQREAKETRDVTLLFVGDIMLSRGVEYQSKKNRDPRYPFLQIADTLRAADLAFGNLEGPISDRGANQGSIYSFRAKPEMIDGVSFAGFDVLSLANNHIWDWGSGALSDTVRLLHERDITTVGAGRNETEANEPGIFVIDDTRFAYLAFTTLLPPGLEARGKNPGVSSFDVRRIVNEIRKLRESFSSLIVIVSLHWGEEYAHEPGALEREIVHALTDAGADLIVGHHPHVVQEVEVYSPSGDSGLPRGESWIAYSLGNFVFDQNFSDETMKGLMLKVRVQGGDITEVWQIPISISSTFQPTLLEFSP